MFFILFNVWCVEDVRLRKFLILVQGRGHVRSVVCINEEQN